MISHNNCRLQSPTTMIILTFLLITLSNVYCFTSHIEPRLIQKRMLTKISNSNLEEDDDDAIIANLYNQVKFLGKGKDAAIEPGVVLISPKFETSHFLSKTAILVCAIGLNEVGDTAVRGVMIDNPTPFTISEMTGEQNDLGSLGDNLLFRGGDEGAESIMLLHNDPDIPSTPIGTDGNLFQGGIDYAVKTDVASTEKNAFFKFFFNYIEYDANALSKILSEEEDGDAWISVSVPTDLILNSDLDRGDAWKGIRNVMKHVYSN